MQSSWWCYKVIALRWSEAIIHYLLVISMSFVILYFVVSPCSLWLLLRSKQCFYYPSHSVPLMLGSVWFLVFCSIGGFYANVMFWMWLVLFQYILVISSGAYAVFCIGLPSTYFLWGVCCLCCLLAVSPWCMDILVFCAISVFILLSLRCMLFCAYYTGHWHNLPMAFGHITVLCDFRV